MGPAYFTYNFAISIIYYLFLECCEEANDACVEYGPYSNKGNFLVILTTSLIYSAGMSLYLVVVLGKSLWRLYWNRGLGYMSLVEL